MQRNKYIKSLEDSIAELLITVNDIKENPMQYAHPERKIKELSERKKALQELIQLINLMKHLVPIKTLMK
jgi:t-SNARE complex subunit (syntaxin)